MSTVVETLNKAGLSAKPYKNPPAGKNNFVIGLYLEDLYVWEGSEENRIEIVTDEDFRQATLCVEEAPREIKRVYSINKATTKNEWKPSLAEVKASFPVALPADAEAEWEWEIDTRHQILAFGKYNAWDDPELEGHKAARRITIRTTVKIEATQANLLVGFDETSQFVCMLPEKAENPQHAHELLRPKGLSDKAKRQGEWFFDPVNENDIKEILNLPDNASILDIIASSGARMQRGEKDYYGKYHGVQLPDWSTHRVDTLLIVRQGKEEILFASGQVTDSRTDRHEPLELDGWHRVVRNLEVEPDPNEDNPLTRRRTYWD